MTRAISIGVLASALVAAIAVAGPVPPPPESPLADPKAIDPIDVVGTYTATLRWTRCSVPGARTAALEVRSVDRKLELDLGPAQEGLGVIGIDGDARKLAGTAADLGVTLVRKKRGAYAITIELDAGCRARGTLRRAASGIAPCDRLVTLARIEAGCSAIAVADRIGDLAELATEQATWTGLRGARKREAATACHARAAPLHSELIDAACVELPADAAPRPVPACRAVAAQMARLARCPSLPADKRAQLRTALAQIATAVDPDTHPNVVDTASMFCAEVGMQLEDLGAQHGC